MRRYYYSLEAFGQSAAMYVEADDANEAIGKISRRHGLKLELNEVDNHKRIVEITANGMRARTTVAA